MIALIGYIGFLTLIASIIAFVSGFGLSIILTSILVFVLPISLIIVLIAPIHWAHSLWKVALYRNYVNWKITIIFGLPAMVTSYLGASLIQYAYHGQFSRILGFF